jgi:hypothetical protein
MDRDRDRDRDIVTDSRNAAVHYIVTSSHHIPSRHIISYDITSLHKH